MNIRSYLEELSGELGRRARVGFFGLGISNMALIRALPEGYPYTVRSDADSLPKGYPYTVSDADRVEGYPCAVRNDTDRVESDFDVCPQAHTRELVPCDMTERVYLGKRALLDIDEDVLFLSPSVRRDRPELVLAGERGCRLMSDCELFFLESRELYAVTGSDGKSTTATLAAALIRGSALVGNIGVPFANAPVCERYVAELSSFQLEYCVPRARRAILTSLSENHLNWHTSYEEYREAKLALIRQADEAILPVSTVGEASGIYPYAVFGRLPLCEAKGIISSEHYITLEGDIIAYDGEAVAEVSRLAFREWYNIENFMGAIALASEITSREDIIRLGESFTGLSHRKELFLSVGGVDFINSSIDTTPRRCAATLEALGRRVVLILGGRGKGLSPDCMLAPIKRYAEGVVLYGEAGLELLPYISELGIPYRYFESLYPAIDCALGLARVGSALLLSPAATGYGEFKNYADRGDAFKAYIRSKFGARSG